MSRDLTTGRNEPAENSRTLTSGFDLAIIGIVGLPPRYGGFETLAHHLVLPLGKDRRILVYCSAKVSSGALHRYHGATLEYLGWDANGWQSIVYDALAMLKSAWRCRTMLVLGVSGCLMLPLIRLLAPGMRIVTNIDGLEWKRRKWGRIAKIVLRLSEAAAVRFSHSVIADNRAIQAYVAERYGRTAVLIPYGGNNQPSSEPSTAAATRRTRFPAGSYFLTVCRIEPENNVAEILEAFSRTPQQPLVLVGNWSVSSYAAQLRARYSALPNVEMLDPIYEPDALRVLRQEAKAYVHGHSAGGTNPTLVEAMYCGLAVLAYDVDYNRHTLGDRGWYWSSAQGLSELAASISDEQMAQCASELRRHAAEHYTWDKVARAYASLLWTDHSSGPA
jgi:glycosyltransferase involved in cell wall biosynthesis